MFYKFFNNKDMFKYKLMILFFFTFIQMGFSQENKPLITNPETFQIVKTSGDLTKEDYKKAVALGDFNPYRLKDKERMLNFVDGTVIKLNSANESQTPLKKERFPNEINYPTVFKLDEKSGIIIELHDSSKEGTYKYNNK